MPIFLVCSVTTFIMFIAGAIALWWASPEDTRRDHLPYPEQDGD